MDKMHMINIESLNPGIRRTVAFLREQLFETVDSGDGKAHEYECDRDVAYVVMRVSPTEMKHEAKRLYNILTTFMGITLVPIGGDDPYIQATYDPADDSALIELIGLDDAMLFGGGDDNKI